MSDKQPLPTGVQLVNTVGTQTFALRVVLLTSRESRTPPTRPAAVASDHGAPWPSWAAR